MAGIEQLLTDMLRLSENQDNADLIFVVGPEEERVYAHRIIMQARCKSFLQKPIGGDSRQISESFRIPNVSSDIFRQFITYVYTGKIIFQDARFLEMMSLAHDFGVEELKTACEDHAISTLSVENACKFLISPKCAASFMDRCITFIGENASECVKTNSFLNLPKDGLIKLISSDYFCLEEENVWRCVLAWAKHQAGVNPLQATAHWTEDERARVCQHLSGVMNHVRLLLIDSKVFAEEVEPTGAVPMELSLERYRYAALNNKMASQTNQSLPAIPQIPEKRLQPRLLLNLFPGSLILKNDKMHFQSVLNNWFGAPKQTWKLVYRASAHGFSAATFHNLCDGIGPTFVIALGARGEISGGFSDVPWAKTSKKGGYIHSDKAFLFALNSSNENSGPTKFDIVKKPYAICYHPDCGPIFGAGADLLISSDCNVLMDSYSNLPHSYNGPGASSSSMFGDYNFLIVDYEVYTIANPGNNSGNLVPSKIR